MNKSQISKIARIWHGVVPADKSDKYFRYLQRTGIKDYMSTNGNRGVQVFRRSENGKTHFLLLTYWDSYESIQVFAGDDYEQARYYPEDKKFLIELEPYVMHYEVLISQ